MPAKATLKTLPAHLAGRVVTPPARSARQACAVPNDHPPAAPLTPPTREVPAETPVGMRFHYEVAQGLHAEQFPHRFRLVVMGPIEEQPAVLAALKNLKETK